ncbi:hypothetical protein [Nocardia sp. NPDC005366]|uniref:hypothetical protein n=1 Tax=Nocardia sp. NPDC005366 TaxID=3156878 RepID=UPI0033A378FD
MSAETGCLHTASADARDLTIGVAGIRLWGMQSELPTLDVLWGRTLVVQVVQDPEGAGQLGELAGGRVTFDMGMANNWFTLERYRDGTAVLFGQGRDDDYIAPVEPQDLLVGAPPWVPVADLTPLMLDEVIDFVRWWDGDDWRHADQLEQLRVEYETAVALYPLLELRQLVGLFAESLHGVTHDEVAALFAAAETRAVTRDLVSALGPDLSDAVFDFLDRGGVVAGSAPVAEELPAPATGPRLRRRITSVEHRRQLVAGMVEASELPRSTPPDSPELADMVARIHLLYREYGHVDFAFRVGRGIGVGVPRNARKIPTGLRRLRDIEAGEYGRWLFIRFTVEGEDVRVDRAYDHWPRWFPRNPYDNDPDRGDLVEELAARAAEARPSWAALAADEFAYVTA